MVLELPSGLFGQKDVREAVESINNKSQATKTAWATSFAYDSVSYIDITNATVTKSGLLATKTYTAIAMSSVDVEGDSGTDEITIAMLIEGTIYSEVVAEVESTSNPKAISVSAVVNGITGVTSITAKLQVKNTGGAGDVNRDTKKKEIILMILEE